MPTIVTVAAASGGEVADFIATRVRHADVPRLRARGRHRRAEVGGTVKNVIAIAAGVSDGLGLGRKHAGRDHHARPRRGEPARDEDGPTLDGHGPRRARRPGGADLPPAICHGTGLSGSASGRGERSCPTCSARWGKQVAEGVPTPLTVDDLARTHQVDMPITAQMRCLLFEDKSPRAAMVDLMTRQPRRNSRALNRIAELESTMANGERWQARQAEACQNVTAKGYSRHHKAVARGQASGRPATRPAAPTAAAEADGQGPLRRPPEEEGRERLPRPDGPSAALTAGNPHGSPPLLSLGV